MSFEWGPQFMDQPLDIGLQLIIMREQVANEVKRKAEKVKNVGLKSSEVTVRARECIDEGYSKLKLQISETFTSRPTRIIAHMFLVASLNQYFEKKLLSDVIAIFQSK